MDIYDEVQVIDKAASAFLDPVSFYIMYINTLYSQKWDVWAEDDVQIYQDKQERKYSSDSTFSYLAGKKPHIYLKKSFFVFGTTKKVNFIFLSLKNDVIDNAVGKGKNFFSFAVFFCGDSAK